jgi:ABC-type transport system involved in cytochrome bd biosynthesis fused ATPase/permease subunit
VVLATHRAHKHFRAERVFRLQQGQLIEETKGPWISSPAKPSLAYIGIKE